LKLDNYEDAGMTVE